MSKSVSPLVVVLILSYNGKHLLKDSLPSYLNNSYENLKVVVIDNGSSDGTFEYVNSEFPESKVIRLSKNRGYSGGFNFGINYAIKTLDTDYVLISNDDVIAHSDLIKQLVKVAIRDNKIGFVTGKVYYHNNFQGQNVIQTVGKNSGKYSIIGSHIGGNELDKGQHDEIKERDFIDDVYTLVSRNVINETGGYDERFYLQSEEADWQLRAKKLGYKIFYTPHALLWHKVGMTTGGRDSYLRHFHSERSGILLVKKHYNFLNSLKYFIVKIFFILPKIMFASFLNSKPHIINAKIRGFFSGLIFIINDR